MSVATVLQDIIQGVREDMETRRSALSLEQVKQAAVLATPALDACRALSEPNRLHVISEVKRSSPSKGSLAPIQDPAMLAAEYETGGASVISVLTEQRRFGGSLDDLDAVRARVDIPILRKDFVIDEYQIYEARAHGADLILLIVAALDQATLVRFRQLVESLGMHALVEVHDEVETERAIAAGARIVGVNARNLKTLDVDTATFGRLAPLLGPGVVSVAESGVRHLGDAQMYARQGAQAVLVGEALVTGGRPRAAVAEMTQAGDTPAAEGAINL